LIRIIFTFILLSLGTSYSFAAHNYSKDIENFAETLVFKKYKENFVLTEEQKLNVTAIPITNRLTFEPCSTPLQGNIVGDKIKNKTSVKVYCNGDKQWDVYVRLDVDVLMPVIISQRALSKGELLDNNNIELIYKAKSQIRGTIFSDLHNLIGTRMKRNLASKKNIQHRDICYVCEDDKVTISAIKNGLIIKASGIALSDGNIGNTVKVKNLRTQRIIIGTVHALNEVYVTF